MGLLIQCCVGPLVQLLCRSFSLIVTVAGDHSAAFPQELNCDLLLLLSNTDGVYTGDPSEASSELIPLMTPEIASQVHDHRRA